MNRFFAAGIGGKDHDHRFAVEAVDNAGQSREE